MGNGEGGMEKGAKGLPGRWEKWILGTLGWNFKGGWELIPVGGCNGGWALG